MTDTPNRQDIINCYRLALGREPEADAVVEEKLSQRKAALLPDFFTSAEFNNGVRQGIVDASPPQPGFRQPPPENLKTWAAAFAPLSPRGSEAVRSAEGWASLYRALFSDEVFAASVLNETARLQNPAFLSALAARETVEGACRIEGRVELVTPHEIRGWALDRAAPARRLSVELWIEGEFRGAVIPDRYRSELQARFGGDGLHGFVISRPVEQAGGGPCRAELREAASGAVIEVFQLPPVGPPPADAAVALRRELEAIRALLSRIEQRLPDLNEAYSYALDLYGDYYDAFYATAAVTSGPALSDLAAIVDATSASPTELDAALASLARQGRPCGQVVVVHPSGAHRLEFEYALSRCRERFPDPASPRGMAVESDWATAVRRAVAATGTPRLLLLDARARLAPDAAGRLHQALQDGAELVYADSDEVELNRAGQVVRHRAPALRTAFDAELFRQQGDLGPLVGMSRETFDTLGLQGEADSALYGMVLRALARPVAPAFMHVPRILAHGVAGAEVAAAKLPARRAALQAHLDATSPGSRAEVHTDMLGAVVPGALKVRRPVGAATRAAVIIPTRDRADLLAPCLASLAGAMDANRCLMEVLVLDNESRETETFALLARFADAFPLRVLPHEGAFNWALINNRAAAETDADVLVFLNNDTVVLAPDWLDALTAQALRPEVGAAGGRLLYGDGTIQHAGVVAGGWHAFAAHEGVGAPGRDPGYQDRHALAREVSAVTGACLASRRSLFQRLGGFDALNLPVEGNDIDFCFRARAEGLKVIYEPACTLYHHESKSRGQNLELEKRRLAEAAGAYMRARWGEAYRDDPFYNPHFDRLAPPLARLRPIR